MIEEYKNKLISFYKSNRRMPGYQEMMKLFGFKSKNAVYKVLNKLVEIGAIEKDSQGHIMPKTLFGSVPMLGLVEAGIPSPAEAAESDKVSLDEMLIEHQDKTYLLEVKGDSMIEEGIKEGDWVIVERKAEPKEGDIVIAEVDGGWTMKYFRRKNGRVFLEPANKKYKPIYPENDMRVAAIVRGVVRKY